MDEDLDELIYDWNVDGERPGRPSSRKVEFDDETLRDGLQSPSVTDPSIDEKIRILHFMHAAGVDNADIGLPGAGPHVVRTVERLAREIVDNKLSVYPSAAGRTHENDVRPIIEISERVGIAIEADLFIGSSPIRQFAEEWDIDWIIAQSVKAVKFGTDNGIPVMYVTEDTTRAKPEDVEKLYTAAIDAGGVHEMEDADLLVDRRIGDGRRLQPVAEGLVVELDFARGGTPRPLAVDVPVIDQIVEVFAHFVSGNNRPKSTRKFPSSGGAAVRGRRL